MEPASGSSRQDIIFKGNYIEGDFKVNALQIIEGVAHEAAGLAGNLNPHPLIYGFPTYLENGYCVGREEDVAELLKLVETHQHVLVRGCGGIGKTTLTMKCAETWTTARWFWQPRRFKKAALLGMEDEEATKRSFIGVAKQCKIPFDNDFFPLLRTLYDQLNKRKILLIFDNINDNMAIKCYLPDKTRHSNIFVLGTAQHHIPELFHGYKLRELSEGAAVELMKGIWKDLEGISDGLLRKLVQSLDCLALAVRQAASVIQQDVNETKKGIVEAIETYMEQSAARFDEKLPQGFFNYYKKTVYASLHYNIHKCANDVLGKKLLNFFSHLNPTCIEKEMLKQVPGLLEKNLKRLIYRFINYSIVAEHDSFPRDYLIMHRTTQAVIRIIYADDKDDVLACVFLTILTYGYGKASFHLPYILPEMSESMLTEGYRSLFTSDTYKTQRDELEGYEEGLVLEWEAPQFAAYLGHGQVLGRLRELSSPDTWVTESGWTWVHAAALRDQSYVLEKNIADSSIKNTQIKRTGQTALHLAARAGSTGSLTELIKRGLNLNIRDVRGDSALHVALSRGHLDIALELLEAGSEINPELCSEITASYFVSREFIFPSSNTGKEDPLKIDTQYLYIIENVEKEGMKPETLIRLSQCADTPRNTQVLKEIQDESGKEFVAVLEAVDGIWEAAVAASRYMRQHHLTVRQLVKEISGEEQIHGVKVVYPPRARCSRALAFTKLLLNKIKNTSPDSFNVLAVLMALPDGHTVHYASDYLDLSTDQIRAVIKSLEGYGILCKEMLTIEMRSLIWTYIALEKLPSDNCVTIFTVILRAYWNVGRASHASMNERFARLVLHQMSLQELTAACKRASHVHRDRRWSQVVKRLKKAGCKSIESPTDVTWNALHYANVFGNSAASNCQQLLIKKSMELGVEVNVRGPNDVTPLHVAASCNTSETVRVLVKNGAQVNAMTHEGLTPLHLAAFSDSEYAHEIVDVLLWEGGQVNDVTHEGLTPLHMAACSDYKQAHEIVDTLLKAEGQVNAVTLKGFTPLHLAASSYSENAVQTVSILLEAGRQVNAVTHQGITPLHMAASSSSRKAYEIVAALLKEGAPVNAVTHEGLTPLHMAASSYSEKAKQTVAVLLGEGAQVNGVTHKGLTSLHMAASSNSSYAPKTVAALLEAGEHVNAVTHEGLTPLHMAAASYSENAEFSVAALLSAGGQVNAVTHEGLTPLYMAAFNYALNADDIVCRLLKAGGQVNAVTKEGLTPLHIATFNNSENVENIIIALLSAGGQVNAVTHEGLTPLHMAASCESYNAKNIVAMLLRAGGRVKAVTNEGLTPLHIAVSSYYRHKHDIVAVLLEAGGQVNAVTHEGLTPLNIAASNDSD